MYEFKIVITPVRDEMARALGFSRIIRCTRARDDRTNNIRYKLARATIGFSTPTVALGNQSTTLIGRPREPSEVEQTFAFHVDNIHCTCNTYNSHSHTHTIIITIYTHTFTLSADVHHSYPYRV